jgi:hypothetical protein
VTASLRRFAWVLNLDAEFELAEPRYQARRRLLEQLAQYGSASARLLGEGDALLGRDRLVSPDDFVGRAWCPTPNAIAQLRSQGVEPEAHPDVTVLKRVNHRRFAHELGGGLPGQVCVATRAALESVLGRADHPWLLKRPLSFAGRGQQRVFARASITAKEWSWIDASLAADVLIVEPLVRPTLELSLHGFISGSGELELGRPCVQEVSARGVFRAVRLARPNELAAENARLLFERAELAARALDAAGYFGPFGVDAYRYELGAQAGFCALGELNARYTLGFLTGFPRHPREIAPLSRPA